jgi:tetratricopeptide (TPR) repeat protein
MNKDRTDTPGAWDRVPWARTTPLIVIVLALTVAVHQRNVAWETKLSLWSDVAEKSPEKSRAHNNLGNCYMLLDKPFSAIEQYKLAVALDPGNIEAYYNLAINLENVGIMNEAAYYYGIFCKAAPPSYSDQRDRSCERAGSLSRQPAKGR